MSKKAIPEEELLSAWVVPIYGNSKATPEEIAELHICKNCEEIRKDHMPDGKCFFASSNFEVKTGFHVIAKE